MDPLLFQRYMSEALEQSPLLYLKLMRFRWRHIKDKHKIICPKTAVMIEGFYRSANSFAVKAFRHTNDPERKLSVATHLHSTAHILVGIKWKIPTLVLLRDPDEAIPSLMSLASQLKKIGDFERSREDQEKYIRYWTGYYARFYERLYPVRSQFVLGHFPDVTRDFNLCIEALNDKFNADFKPFTHTPEVVREIFDSAKVHLSPSEEREKLKVAYREAYHASGNAPARQRAKAIYERFLKD
jgi:hypothetical protein